MDTQLSLAIIAGLLFVNTLFIVIALIKFTRAVTQFQNVLESIRLQVAPITHDATQIVSDVRSIVKSAEKDMVKVGDSLSAVRDTTRNIQEFERLIQDRIERPLLDVTSMLSALIKAGRVFWTHFSKR